MQAARSNVSLSLTPPPQACLVLWRLQWTPEPLGPASAPELFSEGRAMAHVAYLSETIGDHQVGQCRGTEGQGVLGE